MARLGVLTMAICQWLTSVLSILLSGCTIRMRTPTILYLDFFANKNIRMVDRCFAMFQVLYPDTYVESQAQDGASYWFERGTILDSESRKSLSCYFA